MISPSGCLAHQANCCPQKPTDADELENNGKVSFLGKTMAPGKPWEVLELEDWSTGKEGENSELLGQRGNVFQEHWEPVHGLVTVWISGGPHS